MHHHPNGTWVTLPWALPFQKLVAVPFAVQHPYHGLPNAAAASAAAPQLIALHPAAAAAAAASSASLPAALQSFVPTAAFSLQPQPLTIRQVMAECRVPSAKCRPLPQRQGASRECEL
ncbi:hypothetical protein V9T40_011777 [Parthenolecanium corni]|uniref:Uncharacterized protein n=1 Tax=Parthenolecanium corni TaxID=536013 RepID=A0AAN9XYG9_9HEMI